MVNSTILFYTIEALSSPNQSQLFIPLGVSILMADPFGDFRLNSLAGFYPGHKALDPFGQVGKKLPF
jgi:hypothetical protein